MPMVSDERLAELLAAYPRLSPGMREMVFPVVECLCELQLYRAKCREDGETHGFIIREWVRSRMEGIITDAPLCRDCVSGELGADKSYCRETPCENFERRITRDREQRVREMREEGCV